jgi:signal transduction histidine kinase
MDARATESGIAALGELAWGTHFCHFYRSADDLAETIVPYFRAGLARNEKCVWVTSEPLRSDDARTALAAEVPDLADRTARGQIEIVDHATWYRRHGDGAQDEALARWVERERTALAEGYGGVRLTGNTAWLERSGWSSFMEYESRVSEAFAPRRLLGLCSYALDRCCGGDVLEVVHHHEFALARRGGAWELVESGALKVAKSDLVRAKGELEANVAERTAELEAALRARDEFLSVASHELRTPITALQLVLDGLVRAHDRGAVEPADVLRRLKRAQAQGERLAALVKDLLDLSRARAALVELSPEEVNLSAVARDVADRLGEGLARTGTPVRVTAPASVIGRWDRLRLEQVLTNLLANAGRHASGAPVDVAVEPLADGGARLVVRDRGRGIPPADRARIFEPFIQLDPMHGAGGFGLGLWIVRRIVAAHGGTIRAEDAPGGGAAIIVELPAEAPDTATMPVAEA